MHRNLQNNNNNTPRLSDFRGTVRNSQNVNLRTIMLRHLYNVHNTITMMDNTSVLLNNFLLGEYTANQNMQNQSTLLGSSRTRTMNNINTYANSMNINHQNQDNNANNINNDLNNRTSYFQNPEVNATNMNEQSPITDTSGNTILDLLLQSLVDSPIDENSTSFLQNNNDTQTYTLRLDTFLSPLMRGTHTQNINDNNSTTQRQVDLSYNIKDVHINDDICLNELYIDYDLLSFERFGMIEEPINDICPITRERFHDEQNVLMICSCKHIFNSSSLKIWIRNNNSCPSCRSPIRSST